MRNILLPALLLSATAAFSQPAENIILVTTDGFRWQDLFYGMDTAIANRKTFNEGDSIYLYEKYWSSNENTRREKLLPFMWGTLAKQGQLYGNRKIGSEVNNTNPYWFSYPGYSEILTGHVDTAINSNAYPPNPHVTLLEYLNLQPGFKGKVAAFGAWEAFNRIINEDRSGIPVSAAFDTLPLLHHESLRMVNQMLQDSYKPWHHDECLDVFTHQAAFEYLKAAQPRVLYIAYGETDEWAHAGKYRSYLDAAHQVDAWLQQIWNWVQSNPKYRNKTALLITTDHGRGDMVKKEWTSHGSSIKDAYQIWFGVMGPGVRASGEQQQHKVLLQQQFAQTIARLLGTHYKPAHQVAPEIEGVIR